MNERKMKIDKHILNENPLLTIITVVRNGECFIEETIKSVINQSYNNIEYIVIDGGSTDDTIQLIKKYEKNIDYWKSEPDTGIYDAMNKGISMATGKWINFMNAGDVFFDLKVCEKIINCLTKSEVDVIYGDFLATSDIGSILVKAKSISNIFKGSVFSHQSCFVQNKLLKENKFNLQYKIASDYNLFLNLYLKKSHFYYLPFPIASMSIGGLSYSNMATYVEQIKILHSYKPYSIYLLNYIPLIITACIRRIIGNRLTLIIRKLKWSFLKKKN